MRCLVTRSTTESVADIIRSMPLGEVCYVAIRGAEWYDRTGCTDNAVRVVCAIIRRPQGGYAADIYNRGVSGKTVPMAILGNDEWIEGLSVNDRTERHDPA